MPQTFYGNNIRTRKSRDSCQEGESYGRMEQAKETAFNLPGPREVLFVKDGKNNGTEQEAVSLIPKEKALESGFHRGMVFAINPVEGMEIKGCYLQPVSREAFL